MKPQMLVLVLLLVELLAQMVTLQTGLLLPLQPSLLRRRLHLQPQQQQPQCHLELHQVCCEEVSVSLP
jgi:hypothetical protein